MPQWGDLGAIGVNLANVALGVVVLGCVAWVASAVCQEFASRVRERWSRRRFLVYRSRARAQFTASR